MPAIDLGLTLTLNLLILTLTDLNRTITIAGMGAARHGQGGGHLPPPVNASMGSCYCYELYVRVLKSSITVLSLYIYCTYR